MTNETNERNTQELETAETVKHEPAQDPVTATTSDEFISNAWDDLEAEEQQKKLDEENNLAMNRAIDWSDFNYLLPFMHEIVEYLTTNQRRFPTKSMNELATSLEKLAAGFRSLGADTPIEEDPRSKDIFLVVPDKAVFNS
ncbi:MAG: hypothetical protein WCT03_17210 [Candidatus Obscuribacterales bacterium]|jgi:hypothetical protein